MAFSDLKNPGVSSATPAAPASPALPLSQVKSLADNGFTVVAPPGSSVLRHDEAGTIYLKAASGEVTRVPPNLAPYFAMTPAQIKALPAAEAKDVVYNLQAMGSPSGQGAANTLFATFSAQNPTGTQAGVAAQDAMNSGGGLVEGITNAVSGAVDAATGMVTDVAGAVTSTGQTILDQGQSVIDAVPGVVDTIISAPGAIVQAVGEAPGAIYDTAGNLIRDAGTALTNAGGQVVDLAQEVGQGVLDLAGTGVDIIDAGIRVLPGSFDNPEGNLATMIENFPGTKKQWQDAGQTVIDVLTGGGGGGNVTPTTDPALLAPDKDSEEIKRIRRRYAAQMALRGGRASTMLTGGQGDKLGGG